jgi:hypothetical protein
MTLVELLLSLMVALLLLATMLQLTLRCIEDSRSLAHAVEHEWLVSDVLDRMQAELAGCGFVWSRGLAVVVDGPWLDAANRDRVDVNDFPLFFGDALDVSGFPDRGLDEVDWGVEGCRWGMLTQGQRRTAEDPGGVVAVRYRLKRMDAAGGAPGAYALMRAQCSAWNTWRSSFFAGAGQSGGTAAFAELWEDPFVQSHLAANEEVVLTHVLDFGVRVWEQGFDEGWRLVFPSGGDRACWDGSTGGQHHCVVVYLRTLIRDGNQTMALQEGDMGPSLRGRSVAASRVIWMGVLP